MDIWQTLVIIIIWFIRKYYAESIRWFSRKILQLILIFGFSATNWYSLQHHFSLITRKWRVYVCSERICRVQSACNVWYQIRKKKRKMPTKLQRNFRTNSKQRHPILLHCTMQLQTAQWIHKHRCSTSFHSIPTKFILLMIVSKIFKLITGKWNTDGIVELFHA